MRILVVTYEFPPIGGGGGRAAQDICLKLVQGGHKVRVLTSHLKGLPYQEESHGLEIRRVPAARRLPFKASLLDMAGYVVSGSVVGLRHIRDWKPDIMHVHFAVPSGPVAWMIWRYSKVPYVLTAHLGDVPSGVPSKTDRWFRWFYPFTHPIWRDAAQVVAVSQFTRQIALVHYPVNIRVIPNGVDLEELDPGSITVNQPPRIVFAGRFVIQKNPLVLVRTLAKLKHLDWICTMLGDGPLRPEVESEIRSSGLEERFNLPGWVTPEEVIQWFAKSDILFMPSSSEGLPVTGVQATALGLCIVASRIGGFMEIVEHGYNGYLIEAEEISSFARSLERLLSDHHKLLEYRQASRIIARQFDLEKVVEQYESLFETISHPKKA
jgi:glycosyltransferase involved in cell wall biosynthesis